MSSKKLKEWRAAVERRLSELEHAFRSRSSKPNYTTNTSAQEVQGHQEVPSKSTAANLWMTSLKYFGITISLVATPLGIVTGYLALVPKISISQNLPLAPADPFSAPFVVSNDGPLGINNVRIFCQAIKVRAEAQNFQAESLKMQNFIPPISGMEAGEKLSAPCWFPIHTREPITEADIAFRITFRPDFVPWEAKREFRFVMTVGAEGKTYWYPEPYTRIPHPPFP